MSEMRSLVGTERRRLEDHNWATALFTWSFAEMRKRGEINDDPIRKAIIEQLTNWEPSNGAH